MAPLCNQHIVLQKNGLTAVGQAKRDLMQTDQTHSLV